MAYGSYPVEADSLKEALTKVKTLGKHEAKAFVPDTFDPEIKIDYDSLSDVLLNILGEKPDEDN